MLWPQAIEALAQFFHQSATAIQGNWDNVARRSDFRQALPATMLFLTLAFVLILRGRYWVERLVLMLDRHRTAERWLAGQIDDAAAVDDMAARFATLVRAWESVTKVTAA